MWSQPRYLYPAPHLHPEGPLQSWPLILWNRACFEQLVELGASLMIMMSLLWLPTSSTISSTYQPQDFILKKLLVDPSQLLTVHIKSSSQQTKIGLCSPWFRILLSFFFLYFILLVLIYYQSPLCYHFFSYLSNWGFEFWHVFPPLLLKTETFEEFWNSKFMTFFTRLRQC